MRPARAGLERNQRRQESDEFGKGLHTQALDSDRQVVAVSAVAEARRVPRAQVALAWITQKNAVTAPIIGASKAQHITDAVAALKLGLFPEEISMLKAPYFPHRFARFSREATCREVPAREK